MRTECTALMTGAALLLNVAAGAKATAWEYYPGFLQPGHAGIVIGDYDGDGTDEAVVSGKAGGGDWTQLVAVLGTEQGSALDVQSMVMLPNQLVGPLVAAPPVGNADRLIAVTRGDAGYRIVILGGVPIRVLRTIDGPIVSSVAGVADVDGDGELEIVARAGDSWQGPPIILDYQSGVIEWTGTSSNAGANIGMAQLDTDPALEIILGGQPGRIIDGQSHAEEWLYPSGFEGEILVGRFDVDPDVQGFAVATPWSGLQVFRSQPYSPVLQFHNGQIGAAAVAHLVPGGPDQIAIGDGQWGDVSVWDPRTGQPIVTFPNPEHGVSAVAVGNIDGDAQSELVYGAGLSSTGTDLLRAVDLDSLANDYYQNDEIGPYSALVRGDLAGSGSDQVAFLTVSSQSGYEAGSLYVLDAESGEQLRVRENLVGGYSYPRIAMAQLDADPQQELIVTGSGVFDVLDGLSLATQWTLGGGAAGLATIDVNFDGVVDVVVATAATRLMVFDGTNGSFLWESVILNGQTHPAVATFHSPSGTPMALLTVGTGIYSFDLSTQLLAQTAKNPAGVLGLWQWGDGAECRFASLDEEWLIHVRGCTDFTQVGMLQAPYDTTFFRPIDDNASGFLVASGARLYEIRANGVAIPRSGGLGNSLGAGNIGVLKPGSNGQHFELVIGSDYMVTRINVALDAIFADSFEATAP